MSKSFQRFKETKRFQNSILGYLRVLEYTVEKKRKDYIHPHFHILLAVEPRYFVDERYINQKEFLQMWRDATRNQNITQVDIRIIKPNKDKNATASAVAEMCKYPLKDTDISKLTSEQFEKFVLQLKGIRNINAGGNLKNIFRIPDISNTDKTSSFATIPKSKDFSFLEAIEEINALSTTLFLNPPCRHTQYGAIYLLLCLA
jgi:hypothetical protein